MGCVQTTQIYIENHYEKTIQHDSALTGRAWLEELLNSNENRIKNNLGMWKHVFRHLVDVLEKKGGIGNTRHLRSADQVAIFLYFAVTNLSNRKVAERFQKSGDTISKYFHRVLEALTCSAVYNTYIKFPDSSSPVPEFIKDNKKYFPFLKDVLGAIDGRHLLVRPPADQRARYRDRKEQTSQNLLATCTLDMLFCHVLSGWEGSASDSAIFADARKHDFKVPPGKYFLGDAGFPSCRELLVPYRGVRYHLREWQQGNKRPLNAKELFNLRHSSCRNAIERIFGIVKKRFKIMREANEFPIHFQGQIASAICVLHNFIRIHDPDDVIEPDPEEAITNGSPTSVEPTIVGISVQEVTQAALRRDKIAMDMWRQYQAYLNK
ncbi:hypothetical protein M422DRAFT_264575 [Sphaerobolus stellatus SS14]|uniref:Unplaced genomic scaffold SPHSTscaffold_137, whole genome shotgun sequence n=1 Tax=Sphaerobolus stellatus (strain SS14) TaxID=990650 RepID=A0A0C9V7T5_SPHS4|nr:hypothetical protein M422DRAFT_264575 [Sphaerobolus stellatus SS14]